VAQGPLGFSSLLCCRLGPARGRLGWLGEKEWTAKEEGERKDNKRERKERLNIASFKLNILGKLCYMVTLITQ
jgi:hypothetical protein